MRKVYGENTLNFLKFMKRRNFIQSATSAGAGLLILPGYMQSIREKGGYPQKKTQHIYKVPGN